MSIEEAIRKKFKEERRLKEANRWDPSIQPNIYELENFLRKSGYRLVDLVEHKGIDTPELLIEPLKESVLYPEILHDVEEDNFYAKVVEHGLLVYSDVEEVIKGYNTALGVLKYLEALDITKLEISKVDEE